MTVSTDKPALIFLDTEFIEESMNLISIALVRVDQTENGPCTHVYYAEVQDVDYSTANAWVKANVIPRLMGGATVTSKTQLIEDILTFCGPKPTFVGYYADYDWVLFRKLFGRMVDLPEHFPMYCVDIQQTIDELLAKGVELNIETEFVGNHNAMHDAQWIRNTYDYLQGVKL